MLIDIYFSMPKASTKKYKPYLLPSEFSEMERFIEVNKVLMTEQVISSIEYALDKKLNIIEVFSFKDSDFVVTLPFEQFKNNLLHVYNYYIQTEKYELCIRVKKIETKLDNELKKLNAHEKKQKEN